MITQPTNYDPFAAALKALSESYIKEKFGVDVNIIVTKDPESESA